MNTLDTITANKRREVQERKENLPARILERRKLFKRECLPLTRFLLDREKTGIIAEFKRKSPTRGVINGEAGIEEVTTGYFRSGASALSILTDSVYFGGSSSDLVRARELNPLPILRKDFIIDEYQVIESKAIGADAILLIAAVLDRRMTRDLARLARDTGLQVILEIHDEHELDHACAYTDIIGVNNRNLDTLEVDPEKSFQLASLIPAQYVRVAESGINTPLEVIKLRRAGYNGFLIGERFMLSADPARAFSDFVRLLLLQDAES